MIGRKVLLIDDDADFLRLTCRIFEESGAEPITALDGLEGMTKIFTHQPDLIILDALMPGIDGIQICRRIRQFSNTPLMMVSALDQDQLILKGLAAGADDFLSKPINPQVLLARAKAVLRRDRQQTDFPAMLDYNDGHLEIDFEKYLVQVEGKETRLTPVEFRLLAYLVGNAGRNLSYEQILFSVWGSDSHGNEDYVHVYVSNLRSKIEPDPKNPHYITSIYGVGYIFNRQDHIGDLSGSS